MSAIDVPLGVTSSYPLDADAARELVRASCFWQSPDGMRADGPAGRPVAPLGDAVLVLGAFDGLHRGHRKLVSTAVADARSRALPCVAVTFDPDPSEFLQPETPQPQLLAVADRERGLRSLGVDHVVALPFDARLASLSPEEFVRSELLAVARPVSVHVGSNFHFGHRGSGTVRSLRDLGDTFGFDVVESGLVEVASQRISSTRIRALLTQAGCLADANALLGRCHFVRGTVEHGRGEGTSFGFPTANVRCPARACMPREGVYGGYVIIGCEAWPAAINVGAPPSFSGPDELFLEANLIGFSGDIYGADACVTFVQWLRPSRRFPSLEELERVVLGNIDWVRDNLGGDGVRLA